MLGRILHLSKGSPENRDKVKAKLRIENSELSEQAVYILKLGKLVLFFFLILSSPLSNLN